MKNSNPRYIISINVGITFPVIVGVESVNYLQRKYYTVNSIGVNERDPK